ncbi:MAG: hypothetical protein A2X94_09680 [Bdellovibrionales bacterium GWB1_55_8]|nr:MAG: hypothetical protein A2X94_09680 [Bdellovibrionales bacterium GWB1_55_8]
MLTPKRILTGCFAVMSFLLIALNCGFGIASEDARRDSGTELQILYQESKFQEAITRLLASPEHDSTAYHYNLGTLYLKTGVAGLSVAHLEKANTLKRHDADIQYNLQLARSEVSKLLGADRLDPASTAVERLADRISLEEVRGTLGLLAFLISALWLRSYMKSRSVRRVLLQPASLLLLFALSITLLLFGAQRYTELHPSGVLLEPQAVRSGPGNSFLELARVEAGTKLRIVNTAGSPEQGGGTPEPSKWLQVRYSADEIGWVRASSLLLL